MAIKNMLLLFSEQVKVFLRFSIKEQVSILLEVRMVELNQKGILERLVVKDIMKKIFSPSPHQIGITINH